LKTVVRNLGLGVFVGCVLVTQHSFALAQQVYAGRMFLPSSSSVTCTFGSPTGEAQEFFKTLKGSLVTSRHPKYPAVFQGFVSPHGHPSDVVLSNSSGDAQFDADCLLTILAATRTDKSELTLQGFWMIHPNEASQTRSTSAKIPRKAVEVFKIPILVSERYPETYSRAELLSDKNLLFLPGDSSKQLNATQQLAIKNHMEQWNTFFDKNPHADRNMIRMEADSIVAKLKE
jgi:hypothetical protein